MGTNYIKNLCFDTSYRANSKLTGSVVLN